MPTVILVVGVGLLAAALAAVVTAATLMRRERDELDDAFAEARGRTPDTEMATAPWSPYDLAMLHDGATSADADDPFTTLTRTCAPVSWRAASPSNGNGTRYGKRNGNGHGKARVNGSGKGHHGRVAELKPIAWRAPARFVR